METTFIYPPNVANYLSRLVTLIEQRFEMTETDYSSLLIRPRKYMVLPSYLYWLPSSERFSITNLTAELGLDKITRKPGEPLFPLLGATGRGELREIAIGGAVGLDVNFRLYLIVEAPPAEDIVQRVNFTLSHISNIILGSFREIPYWWYTRINGLESVIRGDISNYTIGMIDGVIFGLGHPIAAYPP